MLYLNIQKVEEVTNSSEFHNKIGGTAACMKRIIKYKKGVDSFHQITPYFLTYGLVELI